MQAYTAIMTCQCMQWKQQAVDACFRHFELAKGTMLLHRLLAAFDQARYCYCRTVVQEDTPRSLNELSFCTNKTSRLALKPYATHRERLDRQMQATVLTTTLHLNR
jgi:hypothetical protein